MTHTDLTASQERIAELNEALMTEKMDGCSLHHHSEDVYLVVRHREES